MSKFTDKVGSSSIQDIVQLRNERKGPKKASAKAKPAPTIPQISAPTEKRGPGRPPAKRSSDDYRQITTYVRKALYRKAQNLLDEENDHRPKGATQKTFADVLDEALTEWLSGQGVKL